MYNEIIKELIDRLNISTELSGIIHYGSSNLGISDDFSDIDILIVVESEYLKLKSRGKFKIQGKEVEYFIKTENDIYKELLEEKNNLEPVLLTTLLNGTIIIDKYKCLEKLKQRAIEVEKMPYVGMSKEEVTLKMINLYNELKEIKRKFYKGCEDYRFSYDIYLYEIIEFCYKYNKIPIRKYKLYNALDNEGFAKINLFSDIPDLYLKNEIKYLIEKTDLHRLEKVVEYLAKMVGYTEEYRIFFE